MLSSRFFALAIGIAAFAPAQAPAPEHSFGGTCTSPDPLDTTPVRLQLWLHDYQREAATILADVRAAKDGSYRIERAPWVHGHDWGFRIFVLHATQGRNVAMVFLRGDGAATGAVDVALQPSVTIAGRVTGPTGEPVEGAEVAMRGFGDVWFAAPIPPLRAITDATGRYAIRGAPAGSLQLTCLAERYARLRCHVESADQWNLQLERGAVVAGRVRRADGAPTARLRVCAQGQRTADFLTTTTGDDGRYRLIGLGDDHYNVWIEGEDLTCVALDGQQTEIGGVVEAPELVAIAGGLYVGAVIDDATGKPVRPGDSADVALYGPSRPRSGAACTCSPIAADGTFSIRAAPGENYVYLRPGAGYEPLDGGNVTLAVEDGGRTVIEFRVRARKRN